MAQYPANLHKLSAGASPLSVRWAGWSPAAAMRPQAIGPCTQRGERSTADRRTAKSLGAGPKPLHRHLGVTTTTMTKTLHGTISQCKAIPLLLLARLTRLTPRSSSHSESSFVVSVLADSQCTGACLHHFQVVESAPSLALSSLARRTIPSISLAGLTHSPSHSSLVVSVLARLPLSRGVNFLSPRPTVHNVVLRVSLDSAHGLCTGQ